MRITSKDQVTIPLAIRKKAGFLPDTEVEFELRGARWSSGGWREPPGAALDCSTPFGEGAPRG